MTPLLLAVKNGMWSCVEYLLDHHASIEHCDTQKRTCLIIAASEGHLAVIDSLLEKGLFSIEFYRFEIIFF
jgi:ankyrin repeat protein